MNVTLVHDWLNQMGGAEDVLLELAAMYPENPIYTSIYDPAQLPAAFDALDIRPLWMDRLPSVHRKHQRYLPLYPLAWGGFEPPPTDIVLTNKSGFCHGLRKPSGAVHVCYCLAPTRYVWQFDAYIQREGLGRATSAALRPLISMLRHWDYAAAQRVDHFVAISTEVQERIRAYYNRESKIIYPPVDTTRFSAARTDDVGDYYLIVSRLIPYKRIDLAVAACTKLGVNLKIGGRGRDLDRLKALAGPTVEFLGYVPDDDLPDLMARAKAFIFPGFEDFGITPVQAQAAGRPVIAYASGGALDTVVPGLSGVLFEEQTVDSLADALSAFDATAYDPAAMQAHARTFDRAVFREELAAFVASAWRARDG